MQRSHLETHLSRAIAKETLITWLFHQILPLILLVQGDKSLTSEVYLAFSVQPRLQATKPLT